MESRRSSEGGFTLVELAVGMVVFTVVALSFLALFISMVHSAIIAKEKAVATTLATNQMEYLKSLPYDSLAIQGGPITAGSYLPGSVTKTQDGLPYTVKTKINYVDDAYDGCGSYPTAELKAEYCRNQPSPSGAPATDLNPQDYKIAHVSVYDRAGARLAQVDTEIAARVAETQSTTGALFVSVVDDSGNPVSDATVTITNPTVSPAVNATDSTDSNGIVIFYGLAQDSSGYDYTVSASKTGYSSLTTIKPSGSLQPTYVSQNVITQQSSYATLTLKPQGDNSLLVETTDTSGSSIAGVKVYIKGGYKKYTDSTDTSYYYDNMVTSFNDTTPNDKRPTTNSFGMVGVTGLVPGPYYFCGDKGATSCSIGGTTYYLAAAVPYGGNGALSPVAVPTYDPSNPPTTTYADTNGTSYLQKVRLMLTTNPNFPRVTSLSPSQISLGSDPLSSLSFTLTGANLPCSSSASSCATTVKIVQGSNTYTASCTGTGAGTQLSCTVDVSSISSGSTSLVVSSGGNTLTLPGSPMRGGFNVVP